MPLGDYEAERDYVEKNIIEGKGIEKDAESKSLGEKLGEEGNNSSCLVLVVILGSSFLSLVYLIITTIV